MAWTGPMTWSRGIIADATMMNREIRDNENALAARDVQYVPAQFNVSYVNDDLVTEFGGGYDLDWAGGVNFDAMRAFSGATNTSIRCWCLYVYNVAFTPSTSITLGFYCGIKQQVGSSTIDGSFSQIGSNQAMTASVGSWGTMDTGWQPQALTGIVRPRFAVRLNASPNPSAGNLGGYLIFGFRSS